MTAAATPVATVTLGAPRPPRRERANTSAAVHNGEARTCKRASRHRRRNRESSSPLAPPVTRRPSSFPLPPHRANP